MNSLISDLHSRMKSAGISTYRLAEMTGIPQPNIVRFFRDGRANMQTVEKIAKALNCRLTLTNINAIIDKYHDM